MEREVCFIIGDRGEILYADASASATAMADSQARWQAIWQLREQLVEIAHSHPLGGLYFSAEDETTMEALDSALGRRLRYSVVTPDAVLVRDNRGDGRIPADREPWWVALMRLASGMNTQVS